MNMKKIWHTILICNLLFAVCNLQSIAQTKDLSNEQVNVVKPYQPTLSDTYKISDVPDKDTSSSTLPHLTYSINPKKINTSFETTPIKPVKIKDESITKLYSSLVKAGFGNYTTPYGEFFFNNLRSKEYSFGTHLKHISSSGQVKDEDIFPNFGYSGYSTNEVGIYGKRFFDNKSTLSTHIDYNRNVVHRYGYAANPTDDKWYIFQRFNYFGANAELHSNYEAKDTASIRYEGKINYYYLQDYYQTAENKFVMDATGEKLIKGGNISVNAAFVYTQEDNSLTSFNRTLFHVSPQIRPMNFDTANWHLTAGINFDLESDSLESSYHFYPKATLSYNIVENFLIGYAAIDGGIRENSFKSYTDENPFLNAIVLQKNSNNKLEVSGGLKGTFSNSTSFDARVKYNQIEDMPFFVNDWSNNLQNRFDVVYDNVKLLTVHAEIGHQQTEKLKLIVKGNYYKYTMDKELEPWHKPTLEITLTGNYNIANKIIVKGDVFMLGNRTAQLSTYSNGNKKINTVKLKTLVDVNLGMEYRYTKIMSFFFNFNNIAGLAVQYQFWNNYPLQRFNLMGGLTYAF